MENQISEQEIKVFTIYKIVNIITNKIYVGQTYNLYNRLKSHKACRDKNTLIVKSIIKYGWENHKVEILFQSNSITKKEGNEIETYYIKLHKSFCKVNKLGLNLNEGVFIGRTTKDQNDKKIKSADNNWLKKIGKLGTRLICLNKNDGFLVSEYKGEGITNFFKNLGISSVHQYGNIRRELRKKGWAVVNNVYIMGFDDVDPFIQYKFNLKQRSERSKGRRHPNTINTLNKFRENKSVQVLDLTNGIYFETMGEFCKHENRSYATIYERFAKGKYDGKYLLLKSA